MAISSTAFQIFRDIKRIIGGSSTPGFSVSSVGRSYWRLSLLGKEDTASAKQIRLLEYEVSYFNADTLFALFRDLFLARVYEAHFDNDRPIIIDCGSNIGMSIFFFKTMYPGAQIVGFEPNPVQFDLLSKNIEINELTDTMVLQKAVSDSRGTIDFFLNENDPGSLNMGLVQRNSEAPKISVECELLSDHISDPVDLLKLDIEGAEESVLRDLERSGKLQSIKLIVCEYHHHIEAGVDRLSKTLGILERAGFGYQLLSSPGSPPTLDSYQDVLIYAFNRSSRAGSN